MSKKFDKLKNDNNNSRFEFYKDFNGYREKRMNGLTNYPKTQLIINFYLEQKKI